MKKTILELESISYQYVDGTEALRNVSLQIDYGNKIALLGNNGAGKSTLFLHMNAILKPSTGNIRFQGDKISYKRREIQQLRKDIGIVFQDSDTQLFSATVYEDILYGPRNIGFTKAEIDEAVELAMSLTEIETLKDKPPHFLSLGQKKRVAIAGVLAMKPKLIILDEPTAGLDPYYTKRMMNVLDSIHNHERTILISTHDVNLAYEWADEIWLMHDGQIVSTGSPIQVFSEKMNLEKCHLEKPWIMDVFEASSPIVNKQYPRKREELLAYLKNLD